MHNETDSTRTWQFLSIGKKTKKKKKRNREEPTQGAHSRVTVADAQSRETSAATFRGNIMRRKPDYRVETPFLMLLWQYKSIAVHR